MTNFNPILFPVVQSVSAVIEASSTTSTVVDLSDLAMVGIIMPSIFTGTALTFNGSLDNVNFYPLYNTAGTELSITVSPDIWIEFTPGDFCAVRYLSFVSNQTEGQNRELQIVTRSLM
jgi:hypothetical protein